MTLQEIVRELDRFDRGLTIYAAEPWQPSANAIVARPTDSGGVPDEAVTAGCIYFLEVFIAREVLRQFPSLAGHQPGEAEKCARLIEYAKWASPDAGSQQPAPFEWNFPVSMMIYCSGCEKHFDIVIPGKGVGNYRCPACRKNHVFDLETFVNKAVEQSRKMRKGRLLNPRGGKG